MTKLDFDNFLEKIDLAVVSYVNLLSSKKVSNVEEAKYTIKHSLLNDVNDYVDYKNNSFEFVESLLSFQHESDFTGFYQHFFLTTLLVIPLFKVDPNDEVMKDSLSEILYKLYDEFEN